MDENSVPVIDLFGHPVRPGHGARGRPAFEATERDRNKVKLLLAIGWTIERIANGIGVAPATLKRYFRAELKARGAMRDRLDARRFELAMEGASAGNIAALKELGKMIERSDMMLMPRPAPKEPEPGKKERALRDATRPETGTPLGDLMARRQGSSIN